jgi:hypothetical protein
MVNPTRLAQCVKAPGGASLDEVAASGEQAIANLAEEAKRQMRDSVAALAAAAAAYSARPDMDALKRIHGIVTELYAVAGVFDAPHLAAAAKTLADFIEETDSPARCPPALIGVFAAAIVSLQRGGGEGGRTPAELARELSLLASRALSGKALALS